MCRVLFYSENQPMASRGQPATSSSYSTPDPAGSSSRRSCSPVRPTFYWWRRKHARGEVHVVAAPPPPRAFGGWCMGMIVRWAIALALSDFGFARSRRTCEAVPIVLREDIYLCAKARPLCATTPSQLRKAGCQKESSACGSFAKGIEFGRFRAVFVTPYAGGNRPNYYGSAGGSCGGGADAQSCHGSPGGSVALPRCCVGPATA